MRASPPGSTTVSSVRSRTASLLLGLALLVPVVGCTPTPSPEPDTFVILIDKSASTTGVKNAAFANYLTRYVFPSFTPGARVIIEPIAGANTYSDPDLRIVTTLPAVTQLHKDLTYYLRYGDLSTNKKCLVAAESDLLRFNAARAELESNARRVLNLRQPSPSTFLLDGMKEASESLEQRKGAGILVVLSDGLEDSNTDGQRINFDDDAFWARHAVPIFVRELAPAQSTPGLKGTKVYLDGLAAGRGPIYGHVRQFWRSFFESALVQSQAVGHQPIYEEPPFASTAEDLCK